MGMKSKRSAEMEGCLQNCLDCHRTCAQMAMTHCLEMGGEHVAPDHFRLMLLCAEICRTSATFLMSGSDLHQLTCGVCAQICERCATDCERLGDMDACVEACRRCAESCRSMSK
jgi:hypothetical protein